MAVAMSYQNALDYLGQYLNYESEIPQPYDPEHFSPANLNAFLHTIGAPHQAFPSIHIAGSKGKGSTAAMVTSILTQAGLRTGLFTSPHLVTIRERTQVNRELISQQAFAALVQELRPHIEARSPHQTARIRTFFEILTALSFLYFARQNVDIAVVEVGLGGRLDTTNVLTPNVAVITPIGLEHTHILGNTLAEIAAEKAGIIKPNSQVVSAAQAPEVVEVLEQRCQVQNATLFLAGREFDWQVSEISTHGTRVDVQGFGHTFRNLQVPLLGQHQAANAAVALAVVQQLQAQGFPIETTHIEHGLQTVDWAGRLEIIQYAPLVVLDAGHTPESAHTLSQALHDVFEYQRLWLILGMSRDKNISAIVDCLVPLAHEVIVTPFSNSRSCSPSQLAAEVSRHHRPIHIASDPVNALKKAKHQADAADLICVAGSLFLLGELKAHQQGLPIEF